MIDLSILRAPISRSELSRNSNGDFLDPSGKLVAEYHDSEFRCEWIQHNDYPKLNNVLLREIDKYDQWADEQVRQLAFKAPSAEFCIDNEAIYAKNPNLQKIGVQLSDLIANKRILDIGGSCIDSWRFSKGGAKEVHQVEVSRGSQQLGLARLESKLHGEHDCSANFLFHTSPAEYLPFADSCFDLVFSRSSVHHTDRSLSINEISRVLRRGGHLLLLEPLQTRLNNFVMHAARRLRNADRGTDNPLTKNDLQRLRKSFDRVSMAPNWVIEYDIKKTASWLFRLGSKPAIPVIFAQK